jgi:histidinol-phosphate aminotransferase
LPFEPSTPAQAAGIGALADKEFLHRSLELNARGLRTLAGGLAEAGLPAVPSEANFVMTFLPAGQDAARVFEDLLARGVVVRPLKAFGLPNCLRISTGTDEDNGLCVDALRRVYAANVGATTTR